MSVAWGLALCLREVWAREMSRSATAEYRRRSPAQVAPAAEAGQRLRRRGRAAAGCGSEATPSRTVVSQRSSLDLKFQSNNLSELETVADVFRTPTPGQPMQPLGLAGTALFQGTVRGSTTEPHLTGQLTASNFRFNGTAWRVLRTNVDVSPSMASLEHADLEPATHGKITFNALSKMQ